jgi:hypothetical protein
MTNDPATRAGCTSDEPGSGKSTISLFFLASFSPKVEISPVKSDMDTTFFRSGEADEQQRAILIAQILIETKAPRPAQQPADGKTPEASQPPH